MESLQTVFYQIEWIFDLIKILQEAYPENLITTALMCNMSVECITWFHNEVYWRFCASDCAAAAITNNLRALRYLHEQDCPWDEKTILCSISSGHLECLQYALLDGCPKPSNDVCINHAAGYGQIEVLKYLRSIGWEFNSETLCHAVRPANNLACVKFLVEAGCVMSADVINSAACYGNLVCLQYLREKGCEWDARAPTFATWTGQLACLIYLHRYGCPLNSNITVAAATNNQLACLQYAHKYGCMCTAATIETARKNYSWKCFCYAVWHCTHLDRLLVYMDILALSFGFYFLSRWLIRIP